MTDIIEKGDVIVIIDEIGVNETARAEAAQDAAEAAQEAAEAAQTEAEDASLQAISQVSGAGAFASEAFRLLAMGRTVITTGIAAVRAITAQASSSARRAANERSHVQAALSSATSIFAQVGIWHASIKRAVSVATSAASTAGMWAARAARSAMSAKSSATTAVNASAAVAYRYQWSTNTASSDPGTGKIKANNASPGSATALYISETDSYGNDLAAEIARWDDPTSVNGKTVIKLAKNATNFLIATITASETDNGSWDSLTITPILMVGSFADADYLYLQPSTNGNDGSGTISSGTNHGVAIMSGASSVAGSVVLGGGEILVGQAGADPLNKAMSGDATLAATGAITVTKVNGVTPGTVLAKNTGTSGNTVPLLDGKNTWSGSQTAAGASLTSGVAPDFSAIQNWEANVNGSTFTIANPTAPPDKTYIAILVTFTTANTPAFGSKFKTTGYTAGTSGKDHLLFRYDSTADLYYLVGVRNAVNS